MGLILSLLRQRNYPPPPIDRLHMMKQSEKWIHRTLFIFLPLALTGMFALLAADYYYPGYSKFYLEHTALGVTAYWFFSSLVLGYSLVKGFLIKKTHDAWSMLPFTASQDAAKTKIILDQRNNFLRPPGL